MNRYFRLLAIRFSYYKVFRDAALDIAKSLLEAETQSLQDRYEFESRRNKEYVLLHNMKKESLSKRKTQLEAIRAKCREFDLASFSNATLREKQKRELSLRNE